MAIPRRPIPLKKKHRKGNTIVRLVLNNNSSRTETHRRNVYFKSTISEYAVKFRLDIIPKLCAYASIVASFSSIYMATVIAVSPTLPQNLTNLRLPTSLMSFRITTLNSIYWPILSTIAFKLVSAGILRFELQRAYPLFQCAWRCFAACLLVSACESPEHFALELAARWVSLLIIVMDDTATSFLISKLSCTPSTAPTATATVLTLALLSSQWIASFNCVNVAFWIIIGIVNITTVFAFPNTGN